MKKIVTLILFFYSFAVRAQVIFQKTYDGFMIQWAQYIETTSDGGYVIIGNTNSFGAGSYDIYLIKTDSTGDTLWTKTYGGTGYDAGLCVQQTNDGGYIITGNTGSFGAGATDIILIKTDISGSLVWAKTYGGLAESKGYHVEQTTDGGYIICGQKNYSPSHPYEVCVIKTDAAGNLTWAKNIGGLNNDECWYIRQTTDGGYILVSTTTDFGAGAYDAVLIKISSIGTTQWMRTYGGAGSDFGYSVLQTSDGGYIIGGRTSGFGAGGSDVYLIRTTSSGTLLWSKTYGGAADEGAGAVLQTSNGGFAICTSSRSFNGNYSDVYLIRTDALGNLIWSKIYGTLFHEDSYSVQQATDGGYVMGGNGGGGFYIVKTDSSGFSGCNEGTPATIVTSPTTQVLTPTLNNYVTTDTITSPTVSVGSGTNITTLCIVTETSEATSEHINFLSLFPNPAKDELSITGFSAKAELTLYNTLGEKILSKEFDSGEIKLDVKNLAPGIYVVKVLSGDKMFVKKVVKE